MVSIKELRYSDQLTPARLEEYMILQLLHFVDPDQAVVLGSASGEALPHTDGLHLKTACFL